MHMYVFLSETVKQVLLRLELNGQKYKLKRIFHFNFFLVTTNFYS